MTDRRSFIKQTAVASAGVALLPSCLSSSSSDVLESVGVQLYTVRDAMSVDPRATLKKIGEIGYRKIEAASYDQGKIYGMEVADFKLMVDDSGLELVSGHVPLQYFKEGFDQVVDFAVQSGQQYIVMPWLNQDDRVSIDQYKAYAELLNACGEKAKDGGITVCYHNHDFEFLPLDGQLPIDIILKDTDPALVKMELDLYWISKVGLDPVDFFDQNPSRSVLWHVKDMDNTSDKFFTEVGNGVIDFKRIFDAKRASGMEHFFIEQDQSDDPMRSIEVSFNNLTQKILA
ncbi:MAG: sugar phosphate isomerase/epimerase [Cyclobacteriaceae bacterium]